MTGKRAVDAHQELAWWKALLAITVMVAIGLAMAFSPLSWIVTASIAVFAVAITAKWWIPWLTAGTADR